MVLIAVCPYLRAGGAAFCLFTYLEDKSEILLELSLHDVTLRVAPWMSISFSPFACSQLWLRQSSTRHERLGSRGAPSQDQNHDYTYAHRFVDSSHGLSPQLLTPVLRSVNMKPARNSKA